MRNVRLTKTHPLRRIWRLFLYWAYLFEQKFVPKFFRQIYRMAISGAPSSLVYLSIYIPLPALGWLDYWWSAILATAASWAAYFPIVRHRAFSGHGEVRVEGIVLLGFYLVVVMAQLHLLYLLVESYHLHYLLALFLASGITGSLRYPVTIIIFYLRRWWNHKRWPFH